MRKVIFILTTCLLITSPVFSQSKIEADFGAGFMEGLSTKLKFGNNVQLALCQGYAPGVSTFWLTGTELYFHFGKQSKFASQRTFYVMVGMSATVFATGYDSFEKIVTNARIGRTINFSAKTGLNVDFGIGKLSADDIDGYHSTFLPTTSVHFFVRL